MKPWNLLDSAPVPNGEGELKLFQRDTEFSIRVDYIELMNSRVHGSEEALAELAIERVRKKSARRILIGGLGMGFTLARALEIFGEDDVIDIAELSPTVIEWNKTHLKHLSNDALSDKRVNLLNSDVIKVMKSNQKSYDAVLLDVDNGPEGLTKDDNNKLYIQTTM